MDSVNLHRHLRTWLKEKPVTDVTHCILRFDGVLFVTYCGRAFPIREAVKPVMGARRCMDCESRRRKHTREMSAHVAKR
jgi:hypothetical protein